MPYPKQLGTIACPCVVSGAKPVLFVSRAGGDWQMYCHWKNHDFTCADTLEQLQLVGVAHLLAMDPTLEELADLPVDMGAERTHVGGAWERYEDKDDE